MIDRRVLWGQPIRIVSLLFVSLLLALASPACQSQPEVEKPTAPAQARAVGLPYEVRLPGSPDEYEILGMGGTEPVTMNGKQLWLPWGREYLLREERLSSAGIILECLLGRNGIPYHANRGRHAGSWRPRQSV